ncbi:MAG: DUF1016 domain-containing protein [Firmicutes bacterium]|nr:DUF1016 domain-containing protein [Bacillota bacterium]
MNYLNNIKELIESDIVLKKKNRLIEENSTLNTYFEIGRLIVEAQGGESRAKYGNGLIKEWSRELTNLYGKGYDYTNLSRMRKLYLQFQNVAPPGQLSWTHYKYILPIKEQSKRNYYINLCIKQNLSKNQLIQKIKDKEYERLEYKDNIELITESREITIKDMIKNPIFIRTNEKIDKLSEKALKQFILEKIEEFLLELGYGFTYVGSEYRLGKFKCDLLFFNYELNCFIVIELKIRKLMPTDIGQIKYYMSYIDSNIKKDYMNKTIGIILCKENNEIVVKYITDERVLFSTYQLN